MTLARCVTLQVTVILTCVYTYDRDSQSNLVYFTSILPIAREILQCNYLRNCLYDVTAILMSGGYLKTS